MLEHESLAGTVDLTRPHQGFTLQRVGPCGAREVKLFCVGWEPAAQTQELVLEEVVVQEAKIRAVYVCSLARPLRLELLWRVSSCDKARTARAVMDLIASFHTEELQSQAELTVRSALPATAVWRLASMEEQGAALDGPIDRPGPCPLVVNRHGGFLFHLPCPEVSYLQMVYPRDFRGDTLTCAEGAPPVWELRHRLLSGMLEKGVIVRAWIRGVFCDREDEQAQAPAAYASLAEADPPLSD